MSVRNTNSISCLKRFVKIVFISFLVVSFILSISFTMKEILMYKVQRSIPDKCIRPNIDKYKYKSQSTFTVHILTWNRPLSLKRLLISLNQTDYLMDNVDLVIHIDGQGRKETYRLVEWFHWQFGTKVIVKSHKRRGLAPSWFNAWVPRNTYDRAIVFEDDITVSPKWYQWLKTGWKKYGNRTDLAGISLQRQTLIPQLQSKTGRAQFKEIVNNHQPFLYQLVGSIGFSPHAEKWIQFLKWLEQIDHRYNIDVPGLVTTLWFRQQKEKKDMWTQHFIYFCNKYNLFTLYVNLPKNLTLASHWRDRGQHFRKNRGQDFEEAYNLSMDFPYNLNKYNFAGQIITNM